MIDLRDWLMFAALGLTAGSLILTAGIFRSQRLTRDLERAERRIEL